MRYEPQACRTRTDGTASKIRPVLSVDHVGFTAGHDILCDISLDIMPGEIWAIAGPNGAGKSTLLSIMSGLLKPTMGAVSIDGQDLAAMSARERARQIAVVNQHDRTDLRLTVADYVALGRLPFRQAVTAQAHQAIVDQALDATSIATLRDKEMGVLSGGERQRAHIARALAQEPTLLFLDEPTNHLDPEAKGRMLSLIADLGISVVTILHELALIPLFASHLAILHHGRLRAGGPVASNLTADLVRDVFAVDLLTLAHPHQARPVYALDIPVTRKNTA